MRRRALGQHFLVDEKVLARIVEAGALEAGDLVLEVGVGEGGLTEYLARHAGWVVGLEIDPELFLRARKRLEGWKNVVLLNVDVRAVDFVTLLSPFPARSRKCIANLPYGVSTPFFFRFLESAPKLQWDRFVVMVQYEFGEKLLSLPPQGKGNPLAIGVGRVFSVERLCVVPPSAFHPAPRVYSLLLCGKRKTVVPEDFPAFLHFVTWVFRFRRKTLRSLIPSPLLPEEMATKRAEDLTGEEWEKLWERVRVVPEGWGGYNGKGGAYAKGHLGW